MASLPLHPPPISALFPGAAEETLPGAFPGLPRPNFFSVNIKLFRQNSDEATQTERRCRGAGKKSRWLRG